MTEQEKRTKLSNISAKLSEISGHKAVISSLHKEAFEITKELGIEDELGYDIDNCESEFDYENLSCNISNDEEEWIGKIK